MTERPPAADPLQLPSLFKLMADRIPGVVWATGTDLRFTASFGAGLAALGLDASEVIGKTLFEYFQTDDEAFPPIAAHGRALQGEAVAFEQIWQDRIFRCHVAQLSDDSGSVSGCIGFAQDITEQRQAEDELRRSEARLRSVIDSAPAQVATVDRAGTILFINRPALGLTLENVIGRRVCEFLQPEFRDQGSECIEHVFRTGETVVNECVATGPHGTMSWYETRLGPVKVDGQVIAVTMISSDITERKQAEARLQESEAALKQSRDELEQKVRERTAELVKANASLRAEIQDRLQAEQELAQSEAQYKALVESSPDAILMCDPDGRIMFACHRAAEQLGFDDARDLIGRPATDFVVPEDRDRIQENIRRLLQEGARRNDQYQGLRRDGTTFFGEVSASLIRNPGGEPESFTVVYRDVTERKQAQDALNRKRDALRRLLQASDHDREMITYEIHDGVAQRLLGALMQFEAYERTATHESEQMKTTFEAGLQALREASAETRSLMNRTRTPVLEKFGVKAALADFIDQIGERPNAPEITYRCEVEFRRLAPIIENAIFRVAQEAVTNAFLHSKSELVRVSLVQDGKEVTLEVQDYGIGFDPANVATGRFGLDGIRERSRAFGSNLQLESRLGQGTRVRATFPVIQPDD